MRIIPKASKVKLTFYKGITITDIVIGISTLAIIAITLSSNFSFRFYLAIIILCLVIPLYLPLNEDRLYIHFLYLFKYLFSKKKYTKKNISMMIPYQKIEDDVCYLKDGNVFSSIEIEPVNFDFLSEEKQDELIDFAYSKILNSLPSDYEWILEKVEIPVVYDRNLQDELYRASKIRDMVDNNEITEDEFIPRCDMIQSRINEIDELNSSDITFPRYFLCLVGISPKVVKETLDRAIEIFSSSQIHSHRLNEKELYVLLHSMHREDTDTREERKEIHKPKEMKFHLMNVKEDELYCSYFSIHKYPLNVSNGYLKDLFSLSNTRITMRMKPIEKNKAIRRIDNAILELSTKNIGKESQLQESDLQMETLQDLLKDIQQNNETLFDTTLIVTVYDKDKKYQNRKYVKNKMNEFGFGYSELIARQEDGYLSSQISSLNLIKNSYGIQSSSLAASFPFSADILNDEKGILLGNSSLPIFLDPFKRDLSHVNSNMVILGQSGSGKSFASKTILANLASDGDRIYVLDPESEYGRLAINLGGTRLDASSGDNGRINPLEIMTTMDDINEKSNSFYSHLQFLEQFFKVILDGISHDALEALNRLTEETYALKGIKADTKLSSLKREDYPTLEDLCIHIDEKLKESKDEYELSCLKTLSNWMSRFKLGNRDSSLWNGYTSFSPKECFVVFDFQRLLANHNDVLANAQMLLLLRWLENEVIRNRDYNQQNNANRKIVIAIDEAHLFIDEKYPIALDFMYSMAKRIRKYDGMLLIITQNVKDFTGTIEIVKKASSIINVSQYSLILPLSSDDMASLSSLYEEGGGFNTIEKDTIIHNPRGTAFYIDSTTKRGNIEIMADTFTKKLFEEDSTK